MRRKIWYMSRMEAGFLYLDGAMQRGDEAEAFLRTITGDRPLERCAEIDSVGPETLEPFLLVDALEMRSGFFGHLEEIIQVLVTDVLHLAGGFEFFARVLPDRFDHGVARIAEGVLL